MHDVYGPGVHAYACNAVAGDHICMRGRSVNGRGNPGQHKCACKSRWGAEGECGL